MTAQPETKQLPTETFQERSREELEMGVRKITRNPNSPVKNVRDYVGIRREPDVTSVFSR
ncbi:MAG: hypothetical protein ACLPY5_14185 [Candidatus Bathyarchaeia archaeon]